MRLRGIGLAACGYGLWATLACAAPAETKTTRGVAASPAPSGLQALDAALRELAARVAPSVVQVVTFGYAPASGPGLLVRESGSGSGVVLDASGYVVTNAHVVEGARRIQVLLPPSPDAGQSILKPRGRALGATLVGQDAETDLALLKVDATLPALELADSGALRQGQVVLAVGSPFGFDNTVTLGVISTVARQLEPDSPMIYVQTDAAVNPGNSGGPLVDVQGRVVGLNTLLVSPGGSSDGVGFAVPADIVRRVYDQLRRTGRVRRGEIGVHVQTLTPGLAMGLGLPVSSGVIVSDVLPKGGAARAGVQLGDLVLSLDGKPIENARQLTVNLYLREPGSSVRLELLRGERRVEALVSVSERVSDPESLRSRVSPATNLVTRLGILALDLDDEVLALVPPLRARAGALVAAGRGDAQAGDDGLRPGDAIYAANGRAVTSVQALRDALEPLAPGAPVALQVERAGRLTYVTVAVE